jgi:hypothetical protein
MILSILTELDRTVKTVEERHEKQLLMIKAIQAENSILHAKLNKLKEWVGLTDEEIFEIFRCTGTSNSDINPYVLLDDARKIEAKLKEKNT